MPPTSPKPTSKPIGRTPHTQPTTVQHMSLDHRRAKIGVAHDVCAAALPASMRTRTASARVAEPSVNAASVERRTLNVFKSARPVGSTTNCARTVPSMARVLSDSGYFGGRLAPLATTGDSTSRRVNTRSGARSIAGGGRRRSENCEHARASGSRKRGPPPWNERSGQADSAPTPGGDDRPASLACGDAGEFHVE